VVRHDLPADRARLAVPGDPAGHPVGRRQHGILAADQAVQLLAAGPARVQQHQRRGQLVESCGGLGQIRAGAVRRYPEHGGQAVIIEAVPNGQAQHLALVDAEAAEDLRHDGHLPAVLLSFELGEQVFRSLCVIHYFRRRRAARTGRLIALARQGRQATGGARTFLSTLGSRRRALAADGGVQVRAQAAVGVRGIDLGAVELDDRGAQGVLDCLGRRASFAEQLLRVIK
jgi:hypothetical protein